MRSSAGLSLLLAAGCATAAPSAVAPRKAAPSAVVAAATKTKTATAAEAATGSAPGGARPAPTAEAETKSCPAEARTGSVEAAFARRYRERHCPMCSKRAAVSPLSLPRRKAAPADVLARTAAGLRGRRKRVVLYYFMIPCEPCDRLLPFVKKAMAAHPQRELEVLPVMDALDEQLTDPEVLEALDTKFPARTRRLAGLYRDRAPFGKGFRKIARGTPATVVFSGPDLAKMEVLYGPAQTRFWQQMARNGVPRLALAEPSTE